MPGEAERKILEVPDLIPVLPVRNTVLFPNAAVPLIVGRPKSVGAIRQAQKNNDLLLVLTQRDGGKEEPSPTDLYNVGVICLISKITPAENDSFQLVANGLFRYRVSDFVEQDGYLAARGIQMGEIISNMPAIETLASEIKQLGKAILSLAAIPGADTLVKLFNQIQDPSQVADLCCTFLHLPITSKQSLLEIVDLEKRMQKLLDHMMKEKERLVLQTEIQSKMMERISKDQRDHLLREQLRTIHEELGDDSNIQEEFTKKIEEAGMTEEAKKVAKDELSRLAIVQRSSPEYHVIRTYLDWLTALPWKKTSAPEGSSIDLKEARKILDEDHYGIEKVKNRIIQFLAVRKLKKDTKGPILCLMGPPGVGKTSIAKSIARALGRSFMRTSLGGVRDEAEIRGHRRTYIGSMPGRILQSMKRVGVKDPVILLDEIDKVGTDFRGDPASALLEVLDPEQNHTFMDHYVDVPFDLSQVFFITTANMIDTIPPALRDRLEIIEMASYSKTEKLEIAKQHLLPKVLSDHGISATQVTLLEEMLSHLIDGYTREAGVRNLQRELAQICRWVAEKLASANPPDKVEISSQALETILGPRKFYMETAQEHSLPGVVTGLAWTPVGGEILNIEVTSMGGKGQLLLTGQLGDVMKESAQIALSLLKSYYGKHLPFKVDHTDFHIHVPAGAIPKDGPSAGTAIFLALASFFENKAVSPQIAVTGEITLRGMVMPVGGIKEKVLAAHRAGVKEICMPKRNEADLYELSPEIRNQLNFHFVTDVKELLGVAGLKVPLSPSVPISSPPLSAPSAPMAN